MPNPALPSLRPEIDAVPAPSDDGEELFLLFDRAGISPARLMVSRAVLAVAAHLDGESAVLDVCDRLSGDMPVAPSLSDIGKVIDALDQALFLDSSRFRDFREFEENTFRTTPERVATSSGSAYPDESGDLLRDLDRMLSAAPRVEEAVENAGDTPPRGMIVPHIDYLRGAPGYGQAYGLLARRRPPATVAVIGTAHVPLCSSFAICPKDFATPLGVVRHDRELCSRLIDAAGEKITADMLAHRNEHSVELQAVWLRRIWGADVAIIPLLAGFPDMAGGSGELRTDPVFAAVCEILAEEAAGGRVMIMASADLAHVGPRFGDAREVSDAFLTEVEAADRDYLAAVATGDADSALNGLLKGGDRYHICGSACIHALGCILPGIKGRLLGYHQAASAEMRQAVTYAAMAFE